MSRDAMIKMMESQLGVRGRPNTATRWYAARNGSYFSTAAWCNMLITWAAYQSGNYQAVCFGTDYAYTVYHAERFQREGRWHVDTAGIQRGDIVFFDWNGSNSISAIDHVGIVTDVNGRDVLTIEGNTSDSCARRVRQASTIVGYGRPAYATTTPTPPPPSVPAGLSAASIRAAATGGTKLATYSHSSMQSPVDVFSKNGAVYFHGGMTIDCDGRPGSVCNAQTDPYYQAQTAFQQSDGQHLDAADLPFAVIPLASDTWDYRQHGIRGGDLVLMAYKDRFVCGVVGDLGPTYRIGEASNAAAVALGINGNPRSGGVGSGVTYVVFPGTKVSPIESKSEAVRLGALKGAAWIGSAPAEPEDPPVAVVLTFENAGANGTVWTNKIIQEALNAWNTFSRPLLVDGIFGPVTSARYKQWQESLYGPGPDSDGIPGFSSLTSLGKRPARPFTVIRQGTTPPPPPPTPEPPVTYTPPPLPAGLRPNSASPSAKPLQAALKKAGYLSASVAPADNYGPATQAAVRKFYEANASHGWSPDIAIGPLGWAELHREAYGNGDTTPTPPPPPPPVDDGEPAHNYQRVSYGGKTVNVRTREMLKDAVRHLAVHYDWTPVLTQGSYNTGVGASAGTHDGGGVVDIRTSTMSRSGQEKCVQALRKAGFAAWLRVPPAFSTHIHAVAIGDRELSSAAKSQIAQWRNDTNGLANHGPDPEPDPYPAWTAKYR